MTSLPSSVLAFLLATSYVSDAQTISIQSADLLSLDPRISHFHPAPTQGDESYIAAAFGVWIDTPTPGDETPAPQQSYVESLSFAVSGTADDSRDITAVRLYLDDGDRAFDAELDAQIGIDRSFAADDGTVTFGDLNVPIPYSDLGLCCLDDAPLFVVACDFAGDAQVASTLRISLSETDPYVIVNADGEALTLAAGTLPTWPELRIHPTDLPTLEISPGANSSERSLRYGPGTKDVVLGQARWAATFADWRLEMIGFGTEGTLSEVRHLSNVRLYRDVNGDGLLDGGDEQIAESASVVHEYGGAYYGETPDDGLAFFEDLGHVFRAGVPETWLVVCDLDSRAPLGSTFHLWPGIFQTFIADSTLRELHLGPTLLPERPGWPVLEVGTSDKPTDVAGAAPTGFWLGGATPNPFNPATTIEFSLASAGQVMVSVYSASGQHVRTLLDDSRGAGWNSVVWDGRNERGEDAASGMYVYRISSVDGRLAGRMTLAR